MSEYSSQIDNATPERVARSEATRSLAELKEYVTGVWPGDRATLDKALFDASHRNKQPIEETT